MGTDCHIIGIKKEIREQIGKTIGDTVTVTLKKDELPRIVELPDEVKSFFEQHPQHLEFWNSLSYSVQKKTLIQSTQQKKKKRVLND